MLKVLKKSQVTGIDNDRGTAGDIFKKWCSKVFWTTGHLAGVLTKRKEPSLPTSSRRVFPQ